MLASAGERFQGVDTSLEELIEKGVVSGQSVLQDSGALPLPRAAIAELALRALRQVKAFA
jgi:hypothetical protein